VSRSPLKSEEGGSSRPAAGHDQSHRVGPLGDAPGHGTRDALA
jgi:hypothetical protein